jgi:hypothetical protein
MKQYIIIIPISVIEEPSKSNDILNTNYINATVTIKVPAFSVEEAIDRVQYHLTKSLNILPNG